MHAFGSERLSRRERREDIARQERNHRDQMVIECAKAGALSRMAAAIERLTRGSYAAFLAEKWP